MVHYTIAEVPMKNEVPEHPATNPVFQLRLQKGQNHFAQNLAALSGVDAHRGEILSCWRGVSLG